MSTKRVRRDEEDGLTTDNRRQRRTRTSGMNSTQKPRRPLKDSLNHSVI